MSIEYDPSKSRANLKKQGINFFHAEQALRDPMALTIEDPDSRGEQRFIFLGADSLGRVLLVVHTKREEWSRLISARKASRGEAEKYHA